MRREAKSGGKLVIKRVMPRQNEAVNEIWICDKGRFGYHYAEDPKRLTTPLVRKNGELVKATWDRSPADWSLKTSKLPARMSITLAGGRLSNEDLYQLKQFSQADRRARHWFASNMGGGEWTTRLGLTPGSDLGKLGKGSAILVFASDLHEEAPIWWLRLKQAAERGATLDRRQRPQDPPG